MMDIQSWWPGGILGLPGTDRYHYSQPKQGPKFNLPQRILIGNIILQQRTICSTNWLPLSFAKDKSWKFAFLLSFRLLVLFLEHSGRWGEDWGRIDQTENPLVSPALPLLLLDYPSRIWIPRKSTLPSLGSLYPELTNEFLTLGLLLRWLLKIITLNRDLSGTLFRTDTLAKKDQHKIICL